MRFPLLQLQPSTVAPGTLLRLGRYITGYITFHLSRLIETAEITQDL